MSHSDLNLYSKKERKLKSIREFGLCERYSVMLVLAFFCMIEQDRQNICLQFKNKLGLKKIAGRSVKRKTDDMYLCTFFGEIYLGRWEETASLT